MGGGYFANAGVFLVDAIFSLLIYAVILRFLFQIIRADFYNPLSQAVVAVTNPALRPMRRLIPSLGGLDTASLVLMILLQCISTILIALMIGVKPEIAGVLVTALAELVSKFIYLYIFAIIIQVILSWVAPGTYNPMTEILFSITAPILGPARRNIPPLGGLDFSPLVVIIALQLMLILLVAPLRDLGRTLL
ncbi:MAG: YggT family protein [Pseudomonadota bacterium]